mgnify:CR=1 FL=1
MSATTNNVTIGSVTTTKAFPLISWSIDGTIYSDDDFYRAKLTSSTKLEVSMVALPTGNLTMAW